MSFEVVRAQPADVEEVRTILEGARQWLLSKGINQWIYPFAKTWLARRIEEHEVYLASWSGVFIGTLTIQWSDREIWGEMPDAAGYIHQMAVREEFRGKGLGLQLLRWGEERIASHGKQYVRLDCLADNSKLSAYYEQAGYIFQRRAAHPQGMLLNLYEKKF